MENFSLCYTASVAAHSQRSSYRHLLLGIRDPKSPPRTKRHGQSCPKALPEVINLWGGTLALFPFYIPLANTAVETFLLLSSPWSCYSAKTQVKNMPLSMYSVNRSQNSHVGQNRFQYFDSNTDDLIGGIAMKWSHLLKTEDLEIS